MDSAEKGVTPLHVAAYFGHVPVARMLCESGSPADARERDGRDPFEVAVWAGHAPDSPIVRELREACAPKREGTRLGPLGLSHRLPVTEARISAAVDPASAAVDPASVLIEGRPREKLPDVCDAEGDDFDKCVAREAQVLLTMELLTVALLTVPLLTLAILTVAILMASEHTWP